jgi:HEPN domain-containing protein
MRPPEEVKQELVRQWLAKAEEDFAVAEHLLYSGTEFWGSIGFHAQQAVEKFIKAFLVHKQIEFRKTHDLEELLGLVAGVDEPLAAAMDMASDLNPYGVQVRYPGDFGIITKDDAEQALQAASVVREAILKALRN